MEQPVQIANASGAVGKLDTPRTSNLKFLRDKRLSYFCGKNVKSSLSETDKPQPEIQESLVHCQPKKSESPRRSFSTPSSKAQQPLTIPGVVQVNLNDEADSTPERTFSQPRPQRTSIKEPLSHRSLLSSSFVSGLNQELLEDAYVPESEKLQHVMGWARKFLKKCDGEEYSQTVTNHKDVSSGDNLAMAKNITKEPKGKSNVDPYKLSRATPSVSFNMVQLTNSLENKKNVHISDNLLSSLESFALSDDFGECNSSDMKKLVNEEETREIFCGEQHFKQNVTVIPTLLSDTKSIDTFTNSNYHWNSCQEDKEADHLLASFPSMERNGIEPNAYKNRCFETKSDCEEKNYHRDRGIVDVKHTNILDSDSENSTVKDSGINTTYFERLKGRASSAVSTIDTERLDTLLLDLGMNHKRSEERSHPSDADGSWTDRTFLVKRFVESETTGRDIIVKSNTGSSHNENPEEQSYISHLLKHLPDDISTISSKLCPVCDFLNNSGASSCTECGSILIDSQTKMNEKQTDVKMQIKQKRDQDERCFTRRPNDFLNYSRSFDETSAANPNAKDKKKPIWEEKSDVNSDGNESVLEKYFFYVNHLEMIKSQEQKSGRKLLPANYSSSDLSSEDSFEDHIGVCSPSRTAELNCRFLSESDSEEDETHFLEGAQVTIKPELVYNSQQAMGKGQTSFSNHLKELGMRKPGPRAEKDLIDSLDRKLPKDIHIASKVTGSKRHWEKSSIAWASYTHGELKTRYLQIRHYVESALKSATNTSLTYFETMCHNRSYPTHLITSLYSTIASDTTTYCQPYMTKWEEDLGFPVSDKTWSRIWDTARKTSICAVSAERAYKIIFRWYYTPLRISKLSGNPDHANCFRGCGEQGSFLHTWWTCTVAREFWGKVATLLSEVLQVTIQASPHTFLLGMKIPDIHSKSSHKLATHILTAARSLLAANWKKPHIPGVQTLVTKVNWIRVMESIRARLLDRSYEEELEWHPWTRYLEMPQLGTNMAM
ncbi:uncharacterized protein LOC108705424 isoform X3 [Xenopus laevis]|uniref:Uncharacterized protein LOC108705424 isoform X3 n=1 Tax=Xenopus laevis TaxID=8355 RepID=A0A8J0U7E9_XENLA|nr:uncharacterized protein LOC108705424 isoform X3 [Xenopus laevis]